VTTPERFRRRQRIEMGFLAAVTIAGGITAYVLDQRDDRYSTCLLNYIETDSETTKIRAGLVRDESEATRTIIQQVFSGADPQEAYVDYVASLERIDKARAANPPEEFNEETCQ
jgi:hypothetical protein